MSRSDHLNDVLCHCDQTEDGHPLSTPGCVSEIKPGRYSRDWCSLDHGSEPVHAACHGSARGTCPACGKYGRVAQVKFQTSEGRELFGVRRPGMAPHKTGGQECPGTGQVPAETTYTVGRAEYEYFAARERDGAA